MVPVPNTLLIREQIFVRSHVCTFGVFILNASIYLPRLFMYNFKKLKQPAESIVK